MAAPYFSSPLCLSTDLATLGFPRAADKCSIEPSGDARLHTLQWLASIIDPAFEPATEQLHAEFWNHLGLHSASPNAAGFRPPFTADSERLRDRHAANTFLRAAIDLAMAAQRRRARLRLADAPLLDDEDDHEADHCAPALSQEDIAANAQLDLLLGQRHILFPNTLALLQEHSSRKRRPFSQKKSSVNGSRPDKHAARVRSSDKDSPTSASAVKSREQILDHLRSMQRDAHSSLDAAEQVVDSRTDRVRQESDAVDSSSIRSIAKTCSSLIALVQRFRLFSSESLAFRAARPSVSNRNADVDANTTELSADCTTLATNLEQSLSTIQSVRKSMQKLSHGRKTLESLPSSGGVRAVVERCRQTTLF